MPRNLQKQNRRGVQAHHGRQNQRRAVPAQYQRSQQSRPKTNMTSDFLDETPMKSHETFGNIMFASPGPTMMEIFKDEIALETQTPREVVDKVVEALHKLEHPKRAVKYVGGRGSQDECKKLIKEIENDEPQFHIWTIENGKWVTFDPDPSLIENESFREEQLNDLIKGKKMNEAQTKQFFREEMRKRVERARLEGTKEGQDILMEAEEAYEAVEHRVKSSEDSIVELREKIAELEQTKELAARKLEKMKAEGKRDVRLETEMKLDNLKLERTAEEQARYEEEHAMIMQADVIQNTTKSVPISDVTKKMAAGQNAVSEPVPSLAQQFEEAPAVSEENAKLFESEPLIPAAIPEKEKEEAE